MSRHERALWFNLDGEPTDVHEAERLLTDPEARRIGYDEIPLVGGTTLVVSTVFLVVDHNLGGRVPLLWETMVFDDSGTYHDEYCDRYSTREAAEQGHRDTIELVRSLDARHLGNQS